MMVKRLWSVTILCATLAALGAGCINAEISPTHLTRGYKNKRIAIINATGYAEKVEFDGFTVTWDTSNGKGASHSFEAALTRLHIYEIADRYELDRVLDEMDLQAAQLVNSDLAVQVGKRAKLDGIAIVRTTGRFKLVCGVVMYVKKVLRVRLIDLETSDLVWSGEADMTDWSIIPFIPGSVLFTSAEERMAKSLRNELRKEILW